MSFAVGRIFLTELNGNPNKKNSHEMTCLHILCSAATPVSAEEQDTRLECMDLLLQWLGPADDSGGQNEKHDLAATDDVSWASQSCHNMI